MAILQISRIQVRRGRIGESGVPQLSSGEFAWAIDTQELYIGNGSIEEGAPFLGNTKVLTENDNILDLSRGYFFGVDAGNKLSTAKRKLREKIDEIQVTVNDFKDIDNPNLQTDAELIQTAINELYDEDLESLVGNKFRKVIILPNGTYTISEPILLDDGVVLQGESRDQVILEFTDTGAINFNPNSAPITAAINNVTLKLPVNMNNTEYLEMNNVRYASGSSVTGSAKMVSNNPVVDDNAALPVFDLTDSPASTINNLVAGSGERAGLAARGVGKVSIASFAVSSNNALIFATSGLNKSVILNYRISYNNTTKNGTLTIAIENGVVSQSDSYTYVGDFNDSTLANVDAVENGNIEVNFVVSNGQQGSITYDAVYTF